MEVADWVVAGAVQASWSGPTGRLPLQCPRLPALPALASAPQIFIATPLTAFLPSRSPQTLAQHFLHCTSLLCLDPEPFPLPFPPAPGPLHQSQHLTRPLLKSKFALPSPISPSDIHCTSATGFYHRFLLCIPTHSLLLTRTRHNG